MSFLTDTIIFCVLCYLIKFNIFLFPILSAKFTNRYFYCLLAPTVDFNQSLFSFRHFVQRFLNWFISHLVVIIIDTQYLIFVSLLFIQSANYRDADQFVGFSKSMSSRYLVFCKHILNQQDPVLHQIIYVITAQYACFTI
ncbi:Hypothetical_protein [Hexamita inflata]|uniref:Hypothetical_protein n=1 Tax=Hexamita inflata TaxID=28002 RepID=A0AA86PAY3_9EUKA|nr:Hypothetical protein HINF_LOCUS21010 [Hexamita inflata]